MCVSGIALAVFSFLMLRESFTRLPRIGALFLALLCAVGVAGFLCGMFRYPR
jgi:hypothetical protein